MISSTLQEFYESKGYQCAFCLEAFDTERTQDRPDKRPSMLSCEQHNLCIDCLKGQASTLKNCPTCRSMIVVSKNPQANSQVISSMEVVKELWEQLQGAKKVKVLQDKPAEPKKVLAPEVFMCRSLCIAELPDITNEIAAVLPQVMDTMGWRGGDAKELSDAFAAHSKEWIMMKDPQNKEIKSIGWKKGSYNGYQSELHWVGVKNDDPANYLNFYKAVIRDVQTKFKGQLQHWNDISITSFFNYDNEEKWFKPLQLLLAVRNIRYEIQYLHQRWGTQIKFTIYPIAKPRHQQDELQLDNDCVLVHYQDPEIFKSRECNHYLEKCELRHVFRYSATSLQYVDDAYRTKFISTLVSDFERDPERFFVYSIGGEVVKGFVQFEREFNGSIQVVKCGMNPDSFQYADHFIQEFVTWAKTKPIMNKKQPARAVRFNVQHNVPTALKNAIEPYLE